MAINRRFQLVISVQYMLRLTLSLFPLKKSSFNSKDATFCFASSFPTYSCIVKLYLCMCTFVVAPLSFQEGRHSVLLSSPQFLHYQLLVVFECPQQQQYHFWSHMCHQQSVVVVSKVTHIPLLHLYFIFDCILTNFLPLSLCMAHLYHSVETVQLLQPRLSEGSHSTLFSCRRKGSQIFRDQGKTFL